jgi:type III pantothenate kinase
MHSAFKGGAILPGVAMAISALANSTGEIRIDVKSLTRGFLSVDDLNILATNSDDAVSAGALASVTGGIERCLELIQRVTDTGVKVLITGGDARLIASMMKSSSEVVPNLVLAGLALIAAEDTK